MLTLEDDSEVAGVKIVTLNQPDKLNAMTVEMGEAVAAAVAELKAMPPTELKALVVTGAGRAFSAGGDLDWLLERHNDKPSNNVRAPRRPIFAYAATTLR